jgi:hypothetical protein
MKLLKEFKSIMAALVVYMVGLIGFYIGLPPYELSQIMGIAFIIVLIVILIT